MSELDNNSNNNSNDFNQRENEQQPQQTGSLNIQYQSQYGQNQNPQFQNQYGQNQIQQNQNQQNQNQQNQNQQNQNQQNQNQQYQNQQYENGQYQNGQSYGQQQGKMPQYSFWAEKLPESGYQQNAYSNDYNNTFKLDNQAQPEASQLKRERKALKLVIKAVCFGLIAGISFIGMQILYNKVNPDSNNDIVSKTSKLTFGVNAGKEIETTKPANVKTTSKSDVSDVVKNTMPAIVSINSTSTENNTFFGEQEVEGSGSGIIIGKDEKELLIATNNHVVEGANKITVTFIDGKVANAIIKGTDATADLAVITVDITKLEDSTKNAISVAKLGNSTKVKVGEMAIAIGNALGYGQSVTVGYISAKDRTVDVSDGYDSKKMVLLQTDAAINPGNSGGALLNLNGEVIGINSIKYAANEVEGMGYAIPITRATPIINELKTRVILSKDEQGYLGITGSEVTEDVSKNYNMPVGVYVYDVSKGGAAEKAGLLHGDIITSVNGVEITSMTQLKEKVNSLKVGTKVKIKYRRSADGAYKEYEVSVTLGKNPQLTEKN